MSEARPPQSPFIAVARDLATYGVMSAVSQAGGLLLLPVLTRALSVEAYGSVDIVATCVALLAMLTQLALPSALSRDFHSTDNREGPARMVSTLLACVAAGGALLAGAAAAAAGPLAELLFDDPATAEYLRLGCGIGWLTALLAILYMALRMERRIVAYNLLRLAQTLGYVGLAVWLVLQRGRGVRGVFEAQLVANAAVLVAALVLSRHLLTTQLSKRRLRAALGFSLPMLPGRVAVWVNEQADRLILLAFVGLGGVGILGAAARLAAAVQFLLVVFRQAWQPHAMLMIDEPARDETYRRMLNYYAGSFAMLGLWLTAAGPEIFAVLVPPEYAGGYAALPWLVGAAILHQSAVVTNVGLLVSRETGIITRASFAGVGLNLGLALLLIPPFGVSGAAIGTFVSTFIYTAMLLRSSVKSGGIPFDVGTARTAVVTYVVAASLMLVAWRTLEGPASTAARAALVLLASAWLAPRTLDRQAWNLLRSLRRRLRTQ